jgi:hypothetical protein
LLIRLFAVADQRLVQQVLNHYGSWQRSGEELSSPSSPASH